MADVRVHVQGLDKVLRDIDRTIEGMEDALDEGCQDAAEYLQECIEDKFGVYQPGWKPLQYVTRLKKARKGNGANSNKPLVDFGDMMFSFYTETSNRSRKHTVTVKSDDRRLLYHMFGARSKKRGVPKRDPVRPTVKEERDNCVKMILDKVMEVLK